VLSSKQSSESSAAGSILLLEEYDALAAAIGSALKKFAPGQEVLRARSLAEAERVVLANKPEVLILDVDPPWPGVTGFLQTVRGELPDARALVIGAAIPAEIAAERGSSGAFQFIGKPFELAAFGAAVQAVLGPWAQSAHARGSLQALSTIDLVLLHCAGGGNVVLEVKANGNRTGRIYVAASQVLHAEAGKTIAPEALREILSWTKTHFAESKATSPPARSLQDEWIEIVVDALRKTKPAIGPRLSPPEEPLRAVKTKKIVVVDDTEMLLIFVEDVISTAHPELEITTALSGIEGVQEIGRIMPDLVLLDYSLPDINGDEVCRRLLENEQTAGVPVLMMSGHVAQMKATAEQFENVVATIEKPFLSDALVQLVEKTLATRPIHRPPTRKPRRQKQAERPAPVPPPSEPAKAPSPAKVEAPTPPAPPASPKLAPVEQFTVKSQPIVHPPPPKPRAAISPPPVVAPIPAKPRVQSAQTSIPSPLAAPIVGLTPAIAQPPMIRPVGEANRAVLGLVLEVVSMQLTPQLQMGAIRARPASGIVALHLTSAATRGAIPPETAFQLGPAELGANGRISSLRVIATTQPLQRGPVRNSFEIGGVALIPNHTRARVQLTPAGTTPMTIELLAHLEVGSVQLSATFQVAQLILKWPTNIVRVTLDPKSPDKTGANFQPSEIWLGSDGRITELLLQPAV
jgi:DNA-binding response OmpR family regulator